MPKTKQFIEQEVLDKAKEVFSQKGYNGTSMDDLVKATGLSRSSIYDTFGDKHGLFLKTLHQYQCEENEKIEKLVSKITDPKKRISLFFNAIVKQIVEDKKRQGCLLQNTSMELTCVDKVVASIAVEGMERMEDLFYQWIKEGQAKGDITKRFPARALAHNLYNVFSGLRVTGRTRPDKQTLQEIVNINLSLLEP